MNNDNKHLKLIWSKVDEPINKTPPPPRRGPDKCYICGNNKFQRRVSNHVCTKCGENYKL